MKNPAFEIGNVPVYGDVILAPMAGFSDVPHRALCRSYGSAMSYTEFVAVEDILAGGERVKRLLDYVAEDRPVVFQIFGNNPRTFAEAARRVEALGPDIIDVNMGCSTRRVSGRGAGVGMMQQPTLVAETFQQLARNLSVPITAKIRLGWEGNQNYLEIGRILEDNGAALIAIHSRTKEQKYGGPADWDAIAELKQALSVPVIGNGDVRSPADIDRMFAYTGCDAVMIGRGALGNPWIFSGMHKAALSISEIAQTIRAHLEAMLDYYGDYGLILFRKYLKWYLLDLPGARPYYRQLVVASDSAGFFQVLDKMEQALNGQRPNHESRRAATAFADAAGL